MMTLLWVVFALTISAEAVMAAELGSTDLRRRFPTSWCPLEDPFTSPYYFEFTSSGSSAVVSFVGDLFDQSGGFNASKIDSIIVVPKSVYLAYLLNSGCYNDPSGFLVPAKYFNYNSAVAGGATINFAEFFVDDASGWTGVPFYSAFWTGSDTAFQPTISTSGVNGSFALGNGTEGESLARASAAVTVTGLTNGGQYVVTGWWSMDRGSFDGSYVHANLRMAVRTPLTTGGDLNKDGAADLVWRHYSSGTNSAWLLRGSEYQFGTTLLPVADTNWHIEGTGDFNGDGYFDLIWRNYVTGAVNIWFMRGSQYLSGATLFTVADQNWKIQTVGDFNSDNNPDIVWRNFATGAVNIWFMSGAVYQSGASLFSVTDPNWRIEGSGDFNHDGKRDLMWRNYSTGAVNVWYLNGSQYVSGASLYNVADANWSIEAIADYNGDNSVDLVWRNYSTGAVNVWYLNGVQYLSGANLFTVADTTWRIEGPR